MIVLSVEDRVFLKDHMFIGMSDCGSVPANRYEKGDMTSDTCEKDCTCIILGSDVRVRTYSVRCDGSDQEEYDIVSEFERSIDSCLEYMFDKFGDLEPGDYELVIDSYCEVDDIRPICDVS